LQAWPLKSDKSACLIPTGQKTFAASIGILREEISEKKAPELQTHKSRDHFEILTRLRAEKKRAEVDHLIRHHSIGLPHFRQRFQA
jgi:hypothetical protein